MTTESHAETDARAGTAERRVEQLEAEREQLIDALDHIERTCHGSRTQTRRLRFIAMRCKSAIEGNDEWRNVQLPVMDPLVERLREIIERVYPIAKAELSELISSYSAPKDLDAQHTAEQLIESIDDRSVRDDALVLRQFLVEARRNVPKLNVAELNRGEPWIEL